MKRFTYILCFLVLISSCIEEVSIEEAIESRFNIEELLIVEATLTDQLAFQEVLLSRGSTFANEGTTTTESGASVQVNDHLGNSYSFQEEASGRYISQQAFAAQQGVRYQLSITTSDNVTYQSEESEISGTSSIDAIYAQRIIEDSGAEGMAIFVDSSNPAGDLNDFRYTYEETYQIIAPNWTAFEFEIIREEEENILDPITGEVIETLYPDVLLVPRAQEEQVCYNTVLSNDIILSNGVALTAEQTRGNRVRFIDRNNTIISHRYSILVKQFLQSADAAKFYRTLLQFSQNENLFSEIQPGLIEGNVTAVGDGEKPVIGFFSVASVTEERLFFNYADFFPDEPLPPYFDDVNCNRLIAPVLLNPERDGEIPPNVTCGTPLVDLIKSEEIEFFQSNSDPPPECQGPYFVTFRECGDCTVYGSNVVPDFWTEE